MERTCEWGGTLWLASAIDYDHLEPARTLQYIGTRVIPPETFDETQAKRVKVIDPPELTPVLGHDLGLPQRFNLLHNVHVEHLDQIAGHHLGDRIERRANVAYVDMLQNLRRLQRGRADKHQGRAAIVEPDIVVAIAQQSDAAADLLAYFENQIWHHISATTTTAAAAVVVAVGEDRIERKECNLALVTLWHSGDID